MDFEKRIWEIYADFSNRIHGQKPGLFDANHWQGKVIDWALKDPSFKVDMFRFVDVLSVLETSSSIAQHIDEYLLKEGRQLPGIIDFALKSARSSLVAGIASRVIKKNVRDMAYRFIVGENAGEAVKRLRQIRQDGFCFTVDLLGEATLGGTPGDLYVKIHVKRHPIFRREGSNLLMDLNVKLSDALLGSEYKIPTLDGDIMVKIPEGVAFGELLRVRGKGVPVEKNRRGDLLIKINITLPTKLSKQVRGILDDLRKEGI